MKKYRIVIEINEKGEKTYYVQKRYWFFFWDYLKKLYDVSMHNHKIPWMSLEEAKKHIESDIEIEKRKIKSKIIKRQIYKEI